MTPLTRIFPNRDDPLQQPHVQQNLTQHVQHDRSVATNCLLVAMQQFRSCPPVVLLQNVPPDQLSRKFIQLSQARLHVVHKDCPIFKGDHRVRSHFANERTPIPGSTATVRIPSHTASNAATSRSSVLDRCAVPALARDSAPNCSCLASCHDCSFPLPNCFPCPASPGRSASAAIHAIISLMPHPPPLQSPSCPRLRYSTA